MPTGDFMCPYCRSWGCPGICDASRQSPFLTPSVTGGAASSVERAGVVTDWIEVPGGRLYRTAIVPSRSTSTYINLNDVPAPPLATAVVTTFVPDEEAPDAD